MRWIEDGDHSLKPRKASGRTAAQNLAEAVDAIAELLTSPGPTLLITSRIPLHISMEHEYALDPLPPDAAVELFLDRARAVRRHAEPSATIDEICRRLDGLPLALELAAARLKLLDPPSLLTRLDSRLPLLTHGPSDLPERQRTLEATIAWSYDLLEPDAQRIFTRLSGFAGTFGVEAANAVVDADLDGLTTLVDASLLKPRGDSRFLMLETIREFARDRLVDEDAQSLPSRHAAYFLGLAANAAPHLGGVDASVWLARLDSDHGNFRAALDWLALEEPGELPRFAIALWRFWLVRGHYEEGELWIERALRAQPSPAEHADLHYQLAAILISRGATDRARTHALEALHRYRAIGDRSGEAKALGELGHAATDVGAWGEAVESYERAIEIWRDLDEGYGLGNVLCDLASVYLRSGVPDEALPIALESVELQRAHGNRSGEALALGIAGYAELGTDLARAHEHLVEATRISHDLGFLHGLVFCLNGLGAVAATRGDLERAARDFEAALALRSQIGIHHDPEDVLVADLRAAAFAARVAPSEEFDLDRAIAAALAG